MDEADYLLVSDIHNFRVCPRRWALSAIERKRVETWRMASGIRIHARAHDENLLEKRGSKIIAHALRISSAQLGITGECDIVEFYENTDGIQMHGFDERYMPFPVEYKRGIEPNSDCDRLQLCAQAMCLEEMLLLSIPCGALFYGETHRRTDVEFSAELRGEVVAIAQEMHHCFVRGITPKATKCPFCKECSLLDECLPGLEKKRSVSEYLKQSLEETI